MVGGEHFDLDPGEGNGHTLLRAKRYFDGRHNLHEASAALGVSPDELQDLSDQFAQLGFFREEPDVTEIRVPELLRSFDAANRSWIAQVGYHELFQRLESQTAPREVFLGLLIETYHYVRSASRHIGTALSACRNPRWSHLLAEYLAEEHDHAPLVLRTLEQLGVPQKAVLGSHPAPGTLALINMLSEIARSSTLSYFVAMSFVEARAEDAARGISSVQAVAQSYGFPAGGVESFLSHLLADVEAGHTNILEKALEGMTTVPRSEADAAANHLHDLKHGFDLFHDQILSYYSKPTNYLPRLPVDFNAL